MNLQSEVRYAARTLAKRKGFALEVVATLAIGIGTGSAIFNSIPAAQSRVANQQGVLKIAYLKQF